jgi:hypothetical protein
VPRLLIALAALIVGYTAYALSLAVGRFRAGTASTGLLIWAVGLSCLFFFVAAVFLKLARDRLVARRAQAPGGRAIHWVLLLWTPIALCIVGYGLDGRDVAIILGFGGILVGAVLAPSVPRGFLSSIATVQGVNVSMGVAVFFFPLFASGFLLAFRTHHQMLGEVVAAISAFVFRAIDLLVQHFLRRLGEPRMRDAVPR